MVVALFWPLRKPPDPTALIGPGVRVRYPELAEDLDVIDRHVADVFGGVDALALRRQSAYRRLRSVLIVGSALLSGLGGLQAVFPDTLWPGVVLLVLGVAVTCLTLLAEDDESLQAYYDARMRAERLRAVAFSYLARTGAFSGDDRVTRLQRAVAEVAAGQEPG